LDKLRNKLRRSSRPLVEIEHSIGIFGQIFQERIIRLAKQD